MSRLRRGMVIDVNLDPTKGSETGKIRPCVIVTNNTYNARVPVIQVVRIPAQTEQRSIGENDSPDRAARCRLARWCQYGALRLDIRDYVTECLGEVVVNEGVASFANNPNLL